MTLGSDATGDLYYRNSSGNLTRLGIGSSTQVLTVSGGLPSWQAAGGGGCSGSNGQVLYYSSGCVSDADFLYAGSGGQINFTPAANTTQPFLISGGSTTGSGTSTFGAAITGTLNTTGVVDGAAIFVNVTNTASGSGSSIVDFQVGGASVFAIKPVAVTSDFSPSNVDIDNNGMSINANHPLIFATGGIPYLAMNTQGSFSIPAAGLLLGASFADNGNICWTSTAAINTGAIDTCLFRNAAGVVEIDSGTSGTYRDLKLRNLIATGVIERPSYTVSTLPVSPATGSEAYVSDATTCTFLGSLVGSGSTVCPVFYNGSAWVGG